MRAGAVDSRDAFIISTGVVMSGNRLHPAHLRSRTRLERAPVAHRALITVLLALFVGSCRDVTSSTDRLAPPAATPILVGATVVNLLDGQEPGTQVDVRGLNDVGQVTGTLTMRGSLVRRTTMSPGSVRGSVARERTWPSCGAFSTAMVSPKALLMVARVSPAFTS